MKHPLAWHEEGLKNVRASAATYRARADLEDGEVKPADAKGKDEG